MKNDHKQRPKKALPIPVLRSLRTFGKDIQQARRRRRISTEIMSERAFLSRTTLNKIEKGDPGVSLGNYAVVLFILGLSDKLTDLIDIKNDKIGQSLDDEFLPKRIRKTKNTLAGLSTHTSAHHSKQKE